MINGTIHFHFTNGMSINFPIMHTGMHGLMDGAGNRPFSYSMDIVIHDATDEEYDKLHAWLTLCVNKAIQRVNND